MLHKAIQGGLVSHLMEASPVDDGYLTIQALKHWYGDSKTSQTIIKHYQMKLQDLQLDENNAGTSFINEFIFCS